MSTSYTVGEGSRWEVHLELTTKVPDTNNPDFPGGGTVRPKFVNIGVVPDRETGLWGVWNASVVGPKVKDGEIATKRDYAIPFMSPLDEGGRDVAPEWLRDLCQEWVDRANGISTNSPARGDGREIGLVKRRIASIEEELARDSKSFAQRMQKVSENVDLGVRTGEVQVLAQEADRLAQRALRLEVMKEMVATFSGMEG